ncbi:glycoside hydrolase family 15 protein [Thermomonospora umbrina]|uniref:GH15 family glucan-1,4-alpha-glucosidase n=1 Tax=Thermomonospora umbrina TaxID=111806 RepID=A0A3D9SW60_9ACTN|nr:glycoside hydrolase family 15 protein [Thermomonospora umbrina]REF00079.1 GH15 family glucan-1,4-alpha-glucosidase [Thermomonospora umbrina]
MTAADTPPIDRYAFLSDCRTAALIGPDGAVEWLCTPRFDGPAVFNRILDRRVGGAWELEIEGAPEPSQSYVDTTLVLESRWSCPSGTAVCHDFLAARSPDEGDERGIIPTGVLVRRVQCEKGRVQVRTRVKATPDHARRDAHWTRSDAGFTEHHAGLSLSGTPLSLHGEDLFGSWALTEGETTTLLLGYEGPPVPSDPEVAERMLQETLAAWRDWSSRYVYDGFAAEEVRRSAVVLRGLMHSESGALIAAPTTSLPEWPGGERNWDYRYAWHRDAALVVLVLMRLGHSEEAGRYLRFLLENCLLSDGRLEPMLTLDGGTRVAEEPLPHLSGYANSRPVRIGNEAFEQHQLDVYGQVLDAALAFQQATGGLTDGELGEVFQIVETARGLWREPDDGIWEVRNRPRHWTSSKLYAWVCLDRGIRLAGLTGASSHLPLDDWRSDREAMRTEILSVGYDEERGAFVQSYGDTALDASLLRLSLLDFLEGDDPRVVSTLQRIDEELGTDGLLVHRYDPGATGDGLGGVEGGFLLCAFDMVSALVLAGRVGEALRRFEGLCRCGGGLGLFAEEMSAGGVMLGNHPQAFTHLALIEAAMNLDAAGGGEALHAWARDAGGSAGAGSGGGGSGGGDRS